jgi:hypothetical protein
MINWRAMAETGEGIFWCQWAWKVQLRKPQQWIWIQQYMDFTRPVPEVVRPKALSDKKTDMLYGITEDGQKEIALHCELKRIDQMSMAIKKALYSKQVEYKTLNQNI